MCRPTERSGAAPRPALKCSSVGRLSVRSSHGQHGECFYATMTCAMCIGALSCNPPHTAPRDQETRPGFGFRTFRVIGILGKRGREESERSLRDTRNQRNRRGPGKCLRGNSGIKLIAGFGQPARGWTFTSPNAALYLPGVPASKPRENWSRTMIRAVAREGLPASDPNGQPWLHS